MNELAALPQGIDGELDELAQERAALAERHSEAWRELEAAESSLADAKQRDRDAIAAAMRAGKQRPDRAHTKAAQQAIDEAKETLVAIKHALEANEHDTLNFVAERRTDLSHEVSKRQEDKRGEALDLLEQLSVVLLDFGTLDSLRRWIDCPTTPASGKLQPYSPHGSLRLDAERLRSLGASGKTGVPITNVLDLVGERIESVSYLDGELLQIARSAGLDCNAVERRDSGQVALTNPQAPGVPQRNRNLVQAGLTRFVITKGRAVMQLIVALQTLEAMSVTDMFRLNIQNVESAFASNRRRVIVSVDPTTKELVEHLAGDTSKDREVERQEVVAESKRFKAEQEQLREREAARLGLEPVA